jgi:hypothetical protein
VDERKRRCSVSRSLRVEVLHTKQTFDRFVAHILGNVPVSRLANQSLRIEGDAKSFNEFAAIWEETHNVSVHMSILYVPDYGIDRALRI